MVHGEKGVSLSLDGIKLPSKQPSNQAHAKAPFKFNGSHTLKDIKVRRRLTGKKKSFSERSWG